MTLSKLNGHVGMMIRGEGCKSWTGAGSRDINLVVSDLKPVLRRVKGAVLVANLTPPG